MGQEQPKGELCRTLHTQLLCAMSLTSTASLLRIQSVPIPCCTVSCRDHCCQRRFIPLVLAWARTIHQLQGSTIGETEPGKPSNPMKRLVVDLGSISFEKTCPGLAYVAISRANSMGKGNCMKSTIYFVGESFTKERLTNMTKLKNGGRRTKNHSRRTNWINYLNKHSHGFDANSKSKKYILEWCSSHVQDKAKFEKKHPVQTKCTLRQPHTHNSVLLPQGVRS